MTGAVRFTCAIIILAIITSRDAEVLGQRESCLSLGGSCGKLEYCAEEDRVPNGSCPRRTQVCCQKLPVGPNPDCKSVGGECTDLNCGPMEQPIACPNGLKCCIWVY